MAEFFVSRWYSLHAQSSQLARPSYTAKELRHIINSISSSSILNFGSFLFVSCSADSINTVSSLIRSATTWLSTVHLDTWPVAPVVKVVPLQPAGSRCCCCCCCTPPPPPPSLSTARQRCCLAAMSDPNSCGLTLVFLSSRGTAPSLERVPSGDPSTDYHAWRTHAVTDFSFFASEYMQLAQVQRQIARTHARSSRCRYKGSHKPTNNWSAGRVRQTADGANKHNHLRSMSDACLISESVRGHEISGVGSIVGNNNNKSTTEMGALLSS